MIKTNFNLLRMCFVSKLLNIACFEILKAILYKNAHLENQFDFAV